MKTYCGEISWSIVKYCGEAFVEYCEVLWRSILKYYKDVL